MKFAILSDIHSNVFALEAVLKDIRRRGVDLKVNLGDILYGPIAPRDTYDLLKENEFLTISGNQDRQIYEATQEEIDSNPTMEFILNDLGTAPLDWMKNLPFDMHLSDDVYLCHGTPESDLIYLLEDVTKGYPILRDEQEILRLLGGKRSKLICCGHTHLPRTVSLGNGQLVVNPGSVGLQAYTDTEPVSHSMENYSDKASYSIAEKIDQQWCVSNIKVPYEVQKAVNESKKRARNDWAHFLSTGRKI